MKKSMVFVSFLILNTFFLVRFPPTSSAAPVQGSVDKIAQEAKRGGYQLIDLEKLWTLYQEKQDKILLVDCRQDWEYHSGHIKGAVNFPIEPTWLARMTQRGALEQFLGPEKEKTIVFY